MTLRRYFRRGVFLLQKHLKRSTAREPNLILKTGISITAVFWLKRVIRRKLHRNISIVAKTLDAHPCLKCLPTKMATKKLA